MMARRFLLVQALMLLIVVSGHLSSCKQRRTGAGLRSIGGRPLSTQMTAQLGIVALLPDADAQLQNICTGTLISSHYVLTAAHCLGDSPRLTRVAFGSDALGPDTVYCPIVKSVVHPKFNTLLFENDIALLRVECAIPASWSFARIDNEPRLDAGVRMTAYGFGYSRLPTPQVHESRADSDHSMAPPLNEDGVGLTGQADNVATQTLGILHALDVRLDSVEAAGSQLMVRNDKPGTGLCLGDSGGPIFIGSVQVGLLSASRSNVTCQYDHWFFTRIAALTDWIRATSEVPRTAVQR